MNKWELHVSGYLICHGTLPMSLSSSSPLTRYGIDMELKIRSKFLSWIKVGFSLVITYSTNLTPTYIPIRHDECREKEDTLPFSFHKFEKAGTI